MLLVPNKISPHCPAVIRKIIAAYEDWCFGGRKLPSDLLISSDFAELQTICDQILDPGRIMPLIVVSSDRDEAVWGGISTVISRELIGLAYVAAVDEEKSWEMTSKIGEKLSCYLGAIKLYWPIRSGKQGKPSYELWTAQVLRGFGEDEIGMRRFVSQVRSRIMSVAAQTITIPKSVREIHTSAFKENLDKMESDVREKELNFIIEENEKLTKELELSRSKIAEIEWNLNYYKRRVEKTGCNKSDEEIEGSSLDSDGVPEPQRGDIRFYKKIGNKGGVDVMERVGSCNHREGAWQPAFRADQAEKGIAKLENMDGWQSLQHCGACTGGGRWRVRW